MAGYVNVKERITKELVVRVKVLPKHSAGSN